VTKSHYIDHRSASVGGDGSGTHSIEGNESIDRGIIRYATLEEFRKNPGFAHEGEGKEDPSRMRAFLRPMLGMPCAALRIAGVCKITFERHQVKCRIMQWIRIDTYFRGDLA